ncbi:MAG TPA: hypothetical protein VN749_22245 [Candidatus Eisenbacteria bacterium]|jgi:hypothetical protein|nr:hypothetical protein [Candidatus Eisenbacteria bacterium]
MRELSLEGAAGKFKDGSSGASHGRLPRKTAREKICTPPKAGGYAHDAVLRESETLVGQLTVEGLLAIGLQRRAGRQSAEESFA